MRRTATYLDYNSTAPVRREAAEAVGDVLAMCGNPSSVHGAGRAAHAKLETAREQVASFVGRSPSDVIFTSGGTEANGLALNGTGRRRVFVSAVEHPSVLKANEDAEQIPVNEDGVVDLEWLERALKACPKEGLVSVMAANNETGVCQPIEEVFEICRRHGAVFHCDAVQIPGKAPLDSVIDHAHMVSLSAHKIGGPQGVGALIVREEDVSLTPLLRGGGQERSKRAGTENLPGIVGFGVAANLVDGDLSDAARIGRLRDDLEARIAEVASTVVFAGKDAERLCNTSCFAVPGLDAETLVMAFDLEGIMLSAGSACSSGKVKASHVLMAQGWRRDLAGSAVRISLGRLTTEADIDAFVAAWTAIFSRSGQVEKIEGAAA